MFFLFLLSDSKDSGTGSSEDGDRGGSGGRCEAGGAGGSWSESRGGSGPPSPEPYLPSYLPARRPPPPPPTKPRIWSLADMASKDTDCVPPPSSRLLPAHHPYRPDLYRQLYPPAPEVALLETYSCLGAARGSLGRSGLPLQGDSNPAPSRASPSSSSTSSVSEVPPLHRA